MLYTKEIATILEKHLQEINVKEIVEGGTFKVIATDETKDRDGDIITLEGWEIENYMKNPVILANHDYKIQNIIGKATKIYAEDEKIIVEGIFSKSNPLGVLAEALYNEGMLKTVSVGFIGKRRDGEKITEKELLELSFVAVPSNPSAISLDGKIYEEAVQKGFIIEEKEVDQEILDTVFKNYSEITNMSASELKDWKETECSSLAGLDKTPIDRNIRLKEKNKDEWTETDIKDANRTISFISRMKSNLGGINTIVDSNGKECGTKAYISLKNWAYDDNKNNKSQMQEIKQELEVIKGLLKSLAEDKAEAKASEQARKQAQDLARSLSAYLCEAKKSI